MVTLTADISRGSVTQSTTFTVTVLEGPASNNAYLSNISISGGTLGTAFASTTYTYSIFVSYTINAITVTPTKDHQNATMAVNGTACTGGDISVAVPDGGSVATIVVTAQDITTVHTYTFNITKGNKPTSHSTNTDTPKDTNTVEVDGKQVASVTTTTETKEGDKTVVTVQLDDQKTESLIKNMKDNSKLTIPVKGNADEARGAFSGAIVKKLQDKNIDLEIQTEKAEYKIAAGEIKVDEIAKNLGENIALKDVKININIKDATKELSAALDKKAGEKNVTVLVKPLDFEVKASSGSKQSEVSDFKGYVERSMLVPDNVDVKSITTGVVVDEDGTFRHVPTKVMSKNGKNYAVMKSRTNSTYTVISGSKVFDDVKTHWGKDDINDMAARLIVNGVSEGKFMPDSDISRAEFAAIMVRALGLRPVTGDSAFVDVKGSDWFANVVNTASQNGLIKGVDGKFKPLDNISRQEAMVILARTGLVEDGSVQLGSFADGGQVADWAKTAVASALDRVLCRAVVVN